MIIVFPACDWCYVFWLWAGETHSLFWSPENELPELNCLLGKPHTGEKPGTKCIQVESNFKNSHRICPDSTRWHTQPTAVKMGHKHSLHYRSDQVLGTTPGLLFSLFPPHFIFGQAVHQPSWALVLLPTQKSQGGFLFLCFSPSAQNQPSSYPLNQVLCHGQELLLLELELEGWKRKQNWVASWRVKWT